MLGWAIYDFAINSKSNQVEPTLIDEQINDQQDTIQVGTDIGEIAPDFELITLTGEVIRLSDYRGKRIMLNFWASWCPPCRAEMPDMERFSNDYNVEVIAINLTESELYIEDVQEFVEEYQLSFIIPLDEAAAVEAKYGIRSVPTTFMIDTKGMIQYKMLGALTYQQMVDAFHLLD